MTDMLTATTELEAVNIMLQAIGADPVSSIEVSADSDVTNARSILAETSKEVQSQGWDFNVDTFYPLSRTDAGEYVTPANIIDIKLSDDFRNLKATWRAGKLWDKKKFTFAWDVDLTFNVTWLFPFTELSEATRRYINMQSARRLQARVLGSDTLGRFTAADEALARSIFVDAESVDAEHNILTDSYAVFRVLNRWPSSQAP